MRRILIAIVVMLPFSLMSQNRADTTGVIKIGPCTETRDNNKSPLVFLVYGNNEIRVDSIDFSIIEPDYIRKIEVLKSSKVLKKYNTNAGVVLIYPKRKYKDYYLDKLVDNKTEPNKR